MPQRSRKNSHNRKGRKPKLPPKYDISDLKVEPIKKWSPSFNAWDIGPPFRMDQGQYDGFTGKDKLKIKKHKK